MNWKNLVRKLLFGLPELYFMMIMLYFIVSAVVGVIVGKVSLTENIPGLVACLMAMLFLFLLFLQFNQKSPLLGLWLSIIFGSICIYMMVEAYSEMIYFRGTEKSFVSIVGVMLFHIFAAASITFTSVVYHKRYCNFQSI